MYTPRDRDELARIILGSIVSRSELTDTASGSVIDVLAQSMAALSSSVEYRIARMRDAFDFRNATGAELDERLSEFPPSTIERQSATYATGALIVTLDAQVLDLTIPAGASFSPSSRPEIIYSVIADTVITAGETSKELSVEANLLGPAGNISAERIDTILSAPPELLTVSNQTSISNGRDEETDVSLKRRALLYLQSLARSQPSALEFAALSADVTPRLSLASVYEDPEQRGFSWLYIDDGSGELGLRTQTGQRYTGTATASGPRTIYFDAPAVNAPTLTYVDPVTSLTRMVSTAHYLAIPERGVMYVDASAIPDTAVWTLGAYDVFSGPIAEIQRIIEGDPANPNSSPGWRAAGTRVRVYPPGVQRLSFDLHLVPVSGYDIDELKRAVELAVIDHLSLLRIGEPVFVARLIEIIMSVEGALNIDLYQASTGSSAAPQDLEDLYPASNSVVRLGTLTITPSES